MTALKLSFREWIVVAVVMLVFVTGTPALWKRVESFRPEADARIPYNLGSDYWQYGRFCEQSTTQRKIAVIGDSVVWGHYVRQDQTLSHYLNIVTGQDRFANLGLDGAHPAALHGLMAYYARALAGQTVLLHFNPLWLSSEKHDLSTTKEFEFNHAALVPQFTPRIPCYRASFSRRATAVIERYVPFLSWTAHVRFACFEGLDLAAWTVEHPYDNPLRRIADCGLRIADSPPEANPQSAINNPKSMDLEWIPLENSIQWRSFRQTVALLRAKKNRVFVLVGPFNEYRLSEENTTAYGRIKEVIEEWLTGHDVPHWIAPALPASMYADLSHPVAEGYERLAQQLLHDPAFKAMLDRPSDR